MTPSEAYGASSRQTLHKSRARPGGSRILRLVPLAPAERAAWYRRAGSMKTPMAAGRPWGVPAPPIANRIPDRSHPQGPFAGQSSWPENEDVHPIEG